MITVPFAPECRQWGQMPAGGGQATKCQKQSWEANWKKWFVTTNNVVGYIAMMDTDPEQNLVDVPESWDAYELDPTFVNSRREAIVIFISWFVAMCWAVPYCYYNGYNIADPTDIPTTFGIPSWIVWGIGAPWIAADLFTTWFCARPQRRTTWHS